MQAKKYPQELTDALKGFGSSLTGLAGQMAQGARGASVYNDAIGSGADVAGTALKMLFPKAKLLGTALNMAAKAAGAYFKAANKQADALYKSYNDFNKVGAATSGGMAAVIGNLHSFGYTVNELDKMVALVANNSDTLAKFGGTVGAGTKRFAELSSTIVKGDLGRQLMLAGQMPDDINKGMAIFLKQQTMLGLARKRSDDELIKGAFNLNKEFDILRRITGDTIEQQEKKQDELLMSDVGGSIIARLEEQGFTGQAAALQQFQQMLPDQLRTKLMSTAGGNIGLAPEMLRALPKTVKELGLVARGQSSATAEQLREIMLQDAADTERLYRQQGELGTARDIFAGQEILSVLRSMGAKDPKAIAQANADFAAGAEKNTERMVDGTRAQISTTQAMEKFVNYGVTPATAAMRAFAEITAKIAGVTLPGTPKGGDYSRGAGAGSGAGSAAAGRAVLGSADARAKAEEYLGRKIADNEYSALIKATHAEASAGKGSQQEQAGIMASILNRARTHKGGIVGALEQPKQFQAVTGTAFEPGPSREYRRGPDSERLKSIEGAVALLPSISREQKNFTAASAAAYGKGTNIGYRNDMLAKGGTVVGGTVFQTPVNTAAANTAVPGATWNKVSRTVGQTPVNTAVPGYRAKVSDSDSRASLSNVTAKQEVANNPNQPTSFMEDMERRKDAYRQELLDIARRQLQAQEKAAKNN
jgi:hypothetical protein